MRVGQKNGLVRPWFEGSVDSFVYSDDGSHHAFVERGARSGHVVWDGPIFQLKNQGRPYNYLAPKEGAIAWVDATATPSGAANVDNAYTFINWSLRPENAGLMADTTTYNAAVEGFDQHVSEPFRRNVANAYPGDAIDKLRIQDVEPTWFLEKRQGLVDNTR